MYDFIFTISTSKCIFETYEDKFDNQSLNACTKFPQGLCLDIPVYWGHGQCRIKAYTAGHLIRIPLRDVCH